MDLEHHDLQRLVKNAAPFQGLPADERLQDLNEEQKTCLSYWSVLSESLSRPALAAFMNFVEFPLSDDGLVSLFHVGIGRGIIIPEMQDGQYITQYRLDLEVHRYFAKILSPDDLRTRHEAAHRYYLEQILAIYKSSMPEVSALLEQLTEEQVVDELVKSGALIDIGAHSPEHALFFQWALSRSLYWSEQLFALGKYEHAAHLGNIIFYSLAHQGQARLAKNMLAGVIPLTTGRVQSAALLNLAVLLREDREFESALKIQRRLIIPLLRRLDFSQLGALFSERSYIYRDRGRLLQSFAAANIALLFRLLYKDLKGKAICYSQLAGLYRQVEMFGLALHNSHKAETYWRKSQDQVNLAKTLLTQGNIYNHWNKPRHAMPRLEESLEINRRLNNPPEIASSLGSIARAYMLMKQLPEARAALEESLDLRRRFDPHRIGFEYQALGALYELEGQPRQALEWHKKALAQYEKYIPASVSQCQRIIRKLERKIN
jgi:tetratricopeptide (TPR) repeat protein